MLCLNTMFLVHTAKLLFGTLNSVNANIINSASLRSATITWPGQSPVSHTMSLLHCTMMLRSNMRGHAVKFVSKRLFAVGSPRFVEVVENRLIRDGSNFSCEISSGAHSATSDLTKEAGGSNLGMSPKELLLASLGSCTAMTIRTVYQNSKELAQKKHSSAHDTHGGWHASTLESIFVKVQEWGDHPHIPTKLSVHIDLKGVLSKQQKLALVKASERCPVKTMLSKGIHVETSLNSM